MGKIKIKNTLEKTVLLSLVIFFSFSPTLIITSRVDAADGSNFAITFGDGPGQQKAASDAWSKDDDYDGGGYDGRDGFNNIRIFAKSLFGQKKAVLSFDSKFSHEISQGEHGEPIFTYRYFCRFDNKKILTTSPGAGVENYEVVYAIGFDNDHTPGKGKGDDVVKLNSIKAFGGPILIKKHAKNGNSFTREKVLFDITIDSAQPEEFEDDYNDWRDDNLDPSLGGKESFSEFSHQACRPPSSTIGGMDIKNFNKMSNNEKKQFVGNPSKPPGGSAGTTDGDSLTDCDTKLSNPLSWILCPVIDMGANSTDWLFQNVIDPLLSDIPLSLNPEDGFFKAWQGFRFIANIILVIGMLGIVYSMARGDK